MVLAHLMSIARAMHQRWKPIRIKHRFEKVYHLKVLMVKELNTSQVCSKCKHPKKLVPLKKGLDPSRDDVLVVLTKPHFVRRCTSCLMIWNRDINAARNILFLAKEQMAGRQRPKEFDGSCHRIWYLHLMPWTFLAIRGNERVEIHH